MSLTIARKVAATAALVAGLAVAMGGCGKAAEEIAETAIESNMPDGSTAEISHDGETIKIQGSTGDGGSMDLQAGESVALPSGFPEDIPIPEGITWKLVQSGEDNGKSTVVAQGMLSTPLAEVAAYLKKEAEGKGWAQDQSFQQAGQMEMITYKKEERMLNYTITDTGDGTSVMISSQ